MQARGSASTPLSAPGGYRATLNDTRSHSTIWQELAHRCCQLPAAKKSCNGCESFRMTGERRSCPYPQVGPAVMPIVQSPTRDAAPAGAVPLDRLAHWRDSVHDRAEAALVGYVRDRCAEHVRAIPGADLVTELLVSSVSGGKYVRSTFAYLGWRCGAGQHGAGAGADGDEAALRAAASVELLHAFALIQDDVMDGSAMR